MLIRNYIPRELSAVYLLELLVLQNASASLFWLHISDAEFRDIQ